MAFIPASNVIQAEVRMRLDSQRIENTLYFQPVGAAPSIINMGELGAQLVTWWGTYIEPLVSDQLTLVEVYLTNLTTSTSFTVTYVAGLPMAGGISAAVLPNHVAACVSFRTNGRGRASRGRNYIPGLTENNVVKNTMVPGLVTGLVNAYLQLIDFDGAYDLRWGVLSRYLNGAPRATGFFQPIVGVVMTDDTVDSQRRRLPARGM